MAALASLLTFFSGFGLGTVLTPVFAVFFPLELSIAMTAAVHLLNSLFKLGLVGRFAKKEVVLRFGLPAIGSAFLGAMALSAFSDLPPLLRYNLWGKTFEIVPLKFLMAFLIAAFTLFELIPRLRDLKVHQRYLPLGGILSGFFGGLSGHQGALRSAFLARAGLSKEAFIGTGVVIATLIDLSRLAVYSQHLALSDLKENFVLLLLTTLAAFAGAYGGSKLLKKATMKEVQLVVSLCLLSLATALGLGWI